MSDRVVYIQETPTMKACGNRHRHHHCDSPAGHFGDHRCHCGVAWPNKENKYP